MSAWVWGKKEDRKDRELLLPGEASHAWKRERMCCRRHRSRGDDAPRGQLPVLASMR
jgi:hypothetical protein